MSALKCPNPPCPFLFDPTLVPPGAILTCPRCGMRFTLGPNPYAPPPPPIPGWAPPQTTTHNPVPGPDEIPDAEPIFEEEPGTVNPTDAFSRPQADSSSTSSRPRPDWGEPRKPRGITTTQLALAGGGLLVVSIVFAVVLSSILARRTTSDSDPTTTSTSDRSGSSSSLSEVVFRSPTGKYRVSTYEKIWEPPQAEPKDEDENAVLLLRGTVRAGRSRLDLNPTAKLVILVLEKSGDLDEASRYIRNRYSIPIKDVAETEFSEVTGEPLGENPPGPTNTASVVRWRVRPGGANASSASEKLVVYLAIKIGDDVIIAEGSCSWSDRDKWERRLIQMVGSLRP